MSQLHWEHRSDENVVRVADGGLANRAADTFVLLADVGVARLHRHIADLVDEVRDELLQMLCMTPQEFGAWHPSRKYGEDTAGFGANACVGFKTDGQNLAWLRQPAVVRSLIERGHLSARTPSGKLRSNSTKGEGPIADKVRELPLEEQRALIADAFARADSIDDVFQYSQADVLGLEKLRDELFTLNTTADVLDTLVDQMESFRHQKSNGPSTARGHGRVFAAPLFLMMMVREGMILWPELEDINEPLPRMLKPLIWTVLTPMVGREQSKALGTKLESGVVHRALLLTTDHFSRPGFSVKLLIYRKIHWGPRSQARRQHDATQAYRVIRDHFGLTDEDVGEDARHFGGNLRNGKANTDLAWAWVDDPTPKRLKRFFEIVGNYGPTTFPAWFRDWAEQLRGTLPLFGYGNKGFKNHIDALQYWLIYLWTLGDQAPRSFQDITVEHIMSGPSCYAHFLLRHAKMRKKEHLSILEHAWKLVAQAEGFVGTIPCPIDASLALPANVAVEPVRYRTARVPMPEGVLQRLTELNRADNFKFARDLKLYDRKVVDRTTGKTVTVFWPGVAVIFDMLFNTAMRGDSALWIDSGEGDEYVPGPAGQPIRNVNPVAQVGRRQGVLRALEVRRGEFQPGLFMAVSKTGPKEVPYIDPVLQENILMQQAWNARFNPIKKPIKATRDRHTLKHAAEGLVPEVFPLFRDPKSPLRYPPTSGTVHSYLSRLLAAVEQPFNDSQRALDPTWEHVPLVDEDGKGLYDIHTIRVTLAVRLAEAGVDPRILMEFLGHKSLLMTLYYARSLLRTREELESGFLKIQFDQLAKIEAARERGASAEELETLIGGMFAYRGRESDARTRLKAIPPSGIEIFAHGICPAGDCMTGGESNHPVFRSKGCSRCKHRVTGPAFLAGLVHRSNSLISEIKEKAVLLESENRKRIQAGSGAGARRFRDEIENLQKDIDELWLEYLAEVATTKAVTGLVKNIVPDGHPDSEAFQTVTASAEPTHDIELFHKVLADAELLPGAAVVVPEFAASQLGRMAREIMRLNNIEAAFIRIPSQLQEEALRRFSKLLVAHTNALGEDHHGVFETLLVGEVKIREIAPLSKEVSSLIAGMASLPPQNMKALR